MNLPARPRSWRWMDALLIVGATTAIYGQVIGHSFITFDDSLYVTGNPHVLGGLSWSSFRWAWINFEAANYHPLTWLSYLVDIQCFGLRPGWMAMENALWHALNAWLVARLLAALGCSRWTALLGALAFVAHPVNVESVAWISQRKTMLASAFGLTGILLYCRRANNGRRPVNWVVMLALAASLLSKPWFVVLPAILLVLDVGPLNRLGLDPSAPASRIGEAGWGGILRRGWPLLWEKAPLFALVAAASVAAVLAQKAKGAVVSVQLIPLGLRVENALVSYSDYLKDFFWLDGFSLYYPFPYAIPLPRLIAALGLLAILTGACIAAARRHIAPIAAWIWFLVFLLPVIGIVQVGGQARADRYMYLPIVGLLWLVLHVGNRAWVSLLPALRRILIGGALLWLAMLGSVAYRQVGLWRNTFGIVGHSIAVVGSTPRLVSMLGTAHLQAGRWEAAIPLLERSLRDDPGNRAVVLNLSLAYFRTARLQDAMALTKRVLAQAPDDFAALSNLALFYREEGNLEMAKSLEAKLQRLEPEAGFFVAPEPPLLKKP